MHSMQSRNASRFQLTIMHPLIWGPVLIFLRYLSPKSASENHTVFVFNLTHEKADFRPPTVSQTAESANSVPGCARRGIAQLIVNGIQNGVLRTDSAKLVPRNIYSLYFQWMQRIVSEEVFAGCYYDTFSVLCAADRPISVSLLAHIMKWKKRQTLDFIRLFKQFLIEDTDAQGTKYISLFHDSFRSWLDSEQADAYCVDSEEGLHLLADGFYEAYQEDRLKQTELPTVWEYTVKAGDDKKRTSLLNDETYLKKLLELADNSAELPSMYPFFEEASGLCEMICCECAETDYSDYCRTIGIPLVKARELFCSGDHLGVITALKKSVGDIRQKGSETELMAALRLLGTSSDLVGSRDDSRACFAELLTLAERNDDAFFRKSALIGLAWNSHFTDVSKLEHDLHMLSEIPFSDTKEANIYELLRARVLLSEGMLSDALRKFGAVIERCSGEVWGYDMLSARNQMLLIEAVVACFDNEKFDLGISYGTSLYEHLSGRGTIAECYCASWLAINYAANGLMEKAEHFFFRAEAINSTANSSPKSEWIHMHLKSVKAFLLSEKGNNESAAALHREVACMAEACADPWVEGDALFEYIRLSCMELGRNPGQLAEDADTLQTIAISSQLPHLLFKSRLIRSFLSAKPSADELAELAQTVAENSLPSTDMTMCAYLCMKIAERTNSSTVYASMKESVKRTAAEIINNNPEGNYTDRPLIRKLRQEMIL